MDEREVMLKNSINYVKGIMSHYAKSFYFSAQLLPKEKRIASYCIYGFCRYADNIVDTQRNRTVNELFDELNALRKELRIAYRTGESQNPIIQSFVFSALKYKIPIEYPLELINGVEMDLVKNRYNNFEELYLFSYRVAGVVGLMMTHVLGYTDPSAFIYAEKLGIAMQLTNIIRDIKEDKDRGRIYLPIEELKEFGLSEEDIIKERFSENMKEFIKFQVQRARKYYEESSYGIFLLEPESRFAILLAMKIYGKILSKIEENDYNPFNRRVFVPTSEKIKILIREFLRYKIQQCKRTRECYFKLAEPEQ